MYRNIHKRIGNPNILHDCFSGNMKWTIRPYLLVLKLQCMVKCIRQCLTSLLKADLVYSYITHDLHGVDFFQWLQTMAVLHQMLVVDSNLSNKRFNEWDYFEYSIYDITTKDKTVVYHIITLNLSFSASIIMSKLPLGTKGKYGHGLSSPPQPPPSKEFLTKTLTSLPNRRRTSQCRAMSLPS